MRFCAIGAAAMVGTRSSAPKSLLAATVRRIEDEDEDEDD